MEIITLADYVEWLKTSNNPMFIGDIVNYRDVFYDSTRFVQDIEIHKKPSDRWDYCGVYLWIEKHHMEDSVIYVGRSNDVYYRLYQHYGNNSPVTQYIMTKGFSHAVHCGNYGITCDCIPRYMVRIVLGRFDSFELERKLIKRFRPLLNDAVKRGPFCDLWKQIAISKGYYRRKWAWWIPYEYT